MPVLVYERRLSREAQVAVDPASNQLTLEYIAVGSDNDAEVRAAVVNTIPFTYENLYRDNFKITPLGNGFWEVKCSYTRFIPKLPGEFSRSFDTSGGTHHINVSKETVRKKNWDGDDADAPDFLGAIGVNGDSVEGCDITIPVFAYQETHIFPNARITQAYIEILYAATGCTNSAAWRTFGAGVLLFLGVQGAQRGSLRDPWELTFKFAASPTKSVNVGQSGNVITKEGWNYLWTRFADAVDQNTLVRQPRYSYVERVYDSYSFTLLGIGT